MDPKLELKQHIRNYIKYDREIKRLQNEIKLMKAEQKKVSFNLMDVMRSNEIDCFDINDGQLVYKKNSVKKAIGKQFLLDILNKYFNGDESKVNELNSYIQENREKVEQEKLHLKGDEFKL